MYKFKTLTTSSTLEPYEPKISQQNSKVTRNPILPNKFQSQRVLDSPKSYELTNFPSINPLRSPKNTSVDTSFKRQQQNIQYIKLNTESNLSKETKLYSQRVQTKKQQNQNRISETSIEIPDIDQSIEKYHEQIQAINKSIQKQKEKQKGIQVLSQALKKLRQQNSELVNQNNELKIELGNSKTLNEEYQTEKQYLLVQMRRLRNNTSYLQAEKINLFNQVSCLKNNISGLQAQMKVHQNQIWSLNAENKKFIDQLNFERELSVDYQKENAYLKGQLTNYKNSFQSVVKEIEVMRNICQSEEQLNIKIKHLKEQITQLRSNIQKLQYTQKQNIQLQRRINQVTRQMQTQNDKLNDEINQLKRQSQIQKDLLNQELFIPQDKYVQVLGEREQRISNLVQQNIALEKKNKQLEFEINQRIRVQLLAPRFHTNTQYVSKLVKQSHVQIQQLKRVRDNLQNQLEQLKSHYQEQISASRRKTQQIDRLNILVRNQRNRGQLISQDEISRLYGDKVRLQRKLDILIEKQKGMRSQLLEKDRIIMKYVDKQKSS